MESTSTVVRAEVAAEADTGDTSTEKVVVDDNTSSSSPSQCSSSSVTSSSTSTSTSNDLEAEELSMSSTASGQLVIACSPTKDMVVSTSEKPSSSTEDIQDTRGTGKKRVSRIKKTLEENATEKKVSTPKKTEVQSILIGPQKVGDNKRAKSKPQQQPTVKSEDAEDVFSWRKFLMANPIHDIVHVPLYLFFGVPLQDTFLDLAIMDAKVEFQIDENVETVDGVQKFTKVFWIGTIRKYFGYLAKVEDEGYPVAFHEIPYQWLNFLTDCFPTGHCLTLTDGCLVPPNKISKSEKDWQEILLKRVVGKISIHNFAATGEFAKEQGSGFKIGLALEALDNCNTSRMKQAVVTEVIGSRIFVQYWDSKNASRPSGLWCDTRSINTCIAPPGWCKAVGHELSTGENYPFKALTEDYFDDEDEENSEVADIQIGMKLEAIFPMNPNCIVAATVVSVLKFGYMMISDLASASNLTCFHVSSNNIFPCGFAQESGIELIPPGPCTSVAAKKAFNWKLYLDSTGFKPLAFARSSEPCPAGFAIGSKLEAVDLLNPSIIRVATIVQIKGPLLRIRFEGMTEKFDQWMHYESYDIYPVGWCDTFKHQLLGPKKDSPFWKKYKPQSSYVPRGSSEITRRYHASFKLPLTPGTEAEKKGFKRKATDVFERAAFNSSLMKADAVKLGSKPTNLLRMSTLQELRKTLGSPISSATKSPRKVE